MKARSLFVITMCLLMASPGSAELRQSSVKARVSTLVNRDRALVRSGQLQRGAETFFLRAKLAPGQQPRGRALLLHGLSASPYQGRHLARRLQREGYDVLGLRQAGHGYKEGGHQAPKNLPKMREFGRYTRRGEEALQALSADGQKVHVVGISLGGALSTWLTAHHPERVAAVQLYSPFLAPHKPLHRFIARTAVALDRLTFGGVGRIFDRLPANKQFKPGDTVAIDRARPGYRGGDTRGQTLAVYKVALQARRKLRKLKGKQLPPVSIVSTRLDKTVSNSVARRKLGRHLKASAYEYPAQMGVKHGMWDANESNNSRASKVINPNMMIGLFEGRPQLIQQHVRSGEVMRKQ